MVEKFEVGKTYQWGKTGPEYHVYKCLFVAADGTGFCEVVKLGSGNAGGVIGYTSKMEYPKSWHEVTLPKTGTVWINIYSDFTDSEVHHSRFEADTYVMRGRLACIEVPWTEGQGL